METRTGSPLDERRAELELRRAGGLARPAARPGGTVAVYDTVTEGMVGRQFLRTRRWIGFIAAAVLFAVVCVLLSQWQFDRGQEASAENSVVATNFAAAAIPIASALPALSSYDAGQNWQRVSVTGVYSTASDLVVRNRSNGGENGFEVVTPLQLADGSTFLIDRGWVAPSTGDALLPGPIPAPAAGSVNVVVQLRPSEAPLGSGTANGGQIQSVTLPRLQQQTGLDLYTGAYGVLESQSPPAAPGLAPIQSTMPVLDVGTHYSYALQWLFFALIGFIALGLGARREYRRLNSDDPQERMRAALRVKKNARKAFTDEELEDEAIDGFLPLTRWGLPSGASVQATSGALAARLPDAGPAASVAPPEVYVLEPAQKPEPGDSTP
ncbi:SURF1 family cytochrome oxidase biogenesis protein [Subtercola boreus]|uniref:SURF1-like protein n=1 Tax=Subtercola boreus TaxID=120213 RepID=A0A3E0WB20_9MICO|nr:SURF1 family protein [Subtercola boreus]RFA20002.1 hypothetical protein B7R24_10475 [Subtercola boreus]RFA20131.1 hypothetical protein B7R23_10415 [Subtercola boreus]RFA26458.1 hypothetical protein B7R25_10540 [Subtercola boreus]